MRGARVGAWARCDLGSRRSRRCKLKNSYNPWSRDRPARISARTMRDGRYGEMLARGTGTGRPASSCGASGQLSPSGGFGSPRFRAPVLGPGRSDDSMMPASIPACMPRRDGDRGKHPGRESLHSLAGRRRHRWPVSRGLLAWLAGGGRWPVGRSFGVHLFTLGIVNLVPRAVGPLLPNAHAPGGRAWRWQLVAAAGLLVYGWGMVKVGVPVITAARRPRPPLDGRR